MRASLIARATRLNNPLRGTLLAIQQIARRVPSFICGYALSPLAGGALQQLQHVLVAVAGRLGHALLTGAVRRNVCGELAPSLYIETPLR